MLISLPLKISVGLCIVLGILAGWQTYRVQALKSDIHLVEVSNKTMQETIVKLEAANKATKEQAQKQLDEQAKLIAEYQQNQILIEQAKLETIDKGKVLDEQTRKQVIDIISRPLPTFDGVQ